MSIIAHLGKPGSFSHAAAQKQFGVDQDFIGYESFERVFRAVAKGSADIGVIPLENSLAGSVHENYDLFNTYSVQICAEQYLKVEHYLLGKAGGGDDVERLQEISTVYSHPKALEQCKTFFASHAWMKPTVANDTATAAYLVASSDDQTIAAIGSLESARLYSMRVLTRNVEDDPHNYTRFVYITKQKSDCPTANKCSVQFEVKHETGRLLRVLEVLKKHNANMTKIESRPIHGKPFEYQFSMDFEFPPQSIHILKEIIAEIERRTNVLKILGIYTAGTIPI